MNEAESFDHLNYIVDAYFLYNNAALYNDEPPPRYTGNCLNLAQDIESFLAENGIQSMLICSSVCPDQPSSHVLNSGSLTDRRWYIDAPRRIIFHPNGRVDQFRNVYENDGRITYHDGRFEYIVAVNPDLEEIRLLQRRFAEEATSCSLYPIKPSQRNSPFYVFIDFAGYSLHVAGNIRMYKHFLNGPDDYGFQNMIDIVLGILKAKNPHMRRTFDENCFCQNIDTFLSKPRRQRRHP